MTRDTSTARFYELVWPHRAVVLRAARVLCGNDAEAEDLAQDTMLKAFNALGRDHKVTDVTAWLRRIVRNAWIDRHRSQAARAGDVSLEEIEFDPADRSSPPAPDDPAGLWSDPRAMLQAFSDRQIIEALRRLPAEVRWTLLLVDVEGLDQQEAADVLDVPLGTVKSRLHRGRGMLREALRPLANEMRLIHEQRPRAID